MLRRFKRIKGHAIRARDGDIGHVHDVLFDDHVWNVRYVVVDTGTWLPGRLVIIPPRELNGLDTEDRALEVELTREQIQDSPPIEADQPITRQKAEATSAYFGWPAFWHSTLPEGPTAGLPLRPIPSPALNPAVFEETQRHGDLHLRSTREVVGYHVSTIDGTMGHIEDLVVSLEDWFIRYVVVDTANWWPGRKVVLPPEWISDISWDERKVRFALSKEAIGAAPEFDPWNPISSDDEQRLQHHYGQPSKGRNGKVTV